MYIKIDESYIVKLFFSFNYKRIDVRGIKLKGNLKNSIFPSLLFVISIIDYIFPCFLCDCWFWEISMWVKNFELIDLVQTILPFYYNTFILSTVSF